MSAPARSFTDDMPLADGRSSSVELLEALAPKVRATVRAVLGSTHPDVDDAVQQSLIALVRALPAYRGECEVTGYARVITTRVALAIRRRDRVVQSRRDVEAEPDELAESETSPAETIGATERKAILRDLLAEIPEVQAEALALRIVLGLSLEEVAAHTGVPVNTVRSRLRLAKERLKQRIEADPRLMDALDR